MAFRVGFSAAVFLLAEGVGRQILLTDRESRSKEGRAGNGATPDPGQRLAFLFTKTYFLKLLFLSNHS